jgi:hypothetical protein
MYECSVNCLGPGCEFWTACENECRDKKTDFRTPVEK